MMHDVLLSNYYLLFSRTCRTRRLSPSDLIWMSLAEAVAFACPVPTMSSLEFSASDEEIQISTRLLETSNWHKTDTLSVEAAIGIFKQSGLTFKQLRDIWSIADKKGSGNLSKHELAVVV